MPPGCAQVLGDSACICLADRGPPSTQQSMGTHEGLPINTRGKAERQGGGSGGTITRFSSLIWAGGSHVLSWNAGFMLWPTVRIWGFTLGGKTTEATAPGPLFLLACSVVGPPLFLPHAVTSSCNMEISRDHPTPVPGLAPSRGGGGQRAQNSSHRG